VSPPATGSDFFFPGETRGWLGDKFGLVPL